MNIRLNANAVNITPRRYHHGDLRLALIDAGLALIAQRDAETLSLREVARTVGVSATAVYRHFPDKAALMTALAAEGLARLAATQRAAAARAGSGAAGFAASGRAYVRFALDQPALFRLIFTHPVQASLLDQPLDDVPDAMAFLRANAAAAAGSADAARVLALKSWAVAHGLAMLMLDGQVPADVHLIDTVLT